MYDVCCSVPLLQCLSVDIVVGAVNKGFAYSSHKGVPCWNALAYGVARNSSWQYLRTCIPGCLSFSFMRQPYSNLTALIRPKLVSVGDRNNPKGLSSTKRTLL